MAQRGLEGEVKHPVQAELRRLKTARADFDSHDEYSAYVVQTLETLKKFHVICSWHVTIDEKYMSIDVQVERKCYDSFNESIGIK